MDARDFFKQLVSEGLATPAREPNCPDVDRCMHASREGCIGARLAIEEAAKSRPVVQTPDPAREYRCTRE